MAATDLERLVVQLSADITKFDKNLAKAQGVTNKRLGYIQRQARTSSKAIAASFARAGASIAGAFIGTELIRQATSLSDAATRVSNSLKVAGLSGAQLEKTYDALFASATKYSVPLESLVELYSRVALSQKELGVSGAQVASFTDTIAMTLRVSGKSAQEASGALLQLSQALGGGIVRAEEFNSIQEGAPTILQAAAAGIKEAGGSVAQLRKIMLDGELSSKALFAGIEAGAPVIEQRLNGSALTAELAVTNLGNSLINLAKQFNESTGAGEKLAGSIDGIAQSINSFDLSDFLGKIADANERFKQFLADVKIFDDLNRLTGSTDENGNVINVDKEKAEDDVQALEREVKTLQDRIALNTSLGFDNAEAIARLDEVQAKLAEVRAAAAAMPDFVDGYRVGPNGIEPVTGAEGTNGQMGGSKTRGGRRRVSVTPISVEDKQYKAPASTSSGRRRGGGRGANDYQREIEQIKERTTALNAETAAMAQVNPLVNDYGFALEKARAESDLLAAAQKEGMTITPELRANIEQLATGYANASVAAEKLAKSQDRARETADEFKGMSKDIASGFISDLRSGASAADALSNALDKVLDKVIDIGLNSIFGIGGGGGGLFGGIGKLFGFAKGGIAANGRPVPTFAKGGVSNSAAIFGEAGPEAAVPLPDGRSIPVKFQTPAIPKRGSSGGQDVHVTVGVSADNNGNLMPFVESVSQAQVQKAAPKIVSAANQNVVPTMAKHQANKAGAEWRT